MQLARCRMQQGRSSYRQYCSMSPHLKFNVRVYWTLPSRRIASHEKNRDDTMTLPYCGCCCPCPHVSATRAGKSRRLPLALSMEYWGRYERGNPKKQTDYFDSLIGR